MDNTLVIKLGATGDVVRTTSLLRELSGQVTWITARNNVVLLDKYSPKVRCLAWEDRAQARDSSYDLVISLEDERETVEFLNTVTHKRVFGAYPTGDGTVAYSTDSKQWFDMSLISVHGREKADALKLANRRTYQEMIFEGMGFRFEGQKYVLPEPAKTDLAGDIAIAPVAGPVWPMKNWAYYEDLKRKLEAKGLKVNVLPRRTSLLEHLGDVNNHRCLVGGDSLPMHMALGLEIPSVTLFTCTSPWEIYDYGIQTKIISPLLERFFYKRGFDQAAVTSITLDEVLGEVLKKI